MTFPTAPLEKDLEIRRPIKARPLCLLDQRDTDFIITASEQYANRRTNARRASTSVSSRCEGLAARLDRALDEQHSTEMEPYHLHTQPEPLKPGEVYRFDIGLEPNAFQFKKGNRIRLEIVNGDSPITDVLWTHYYQPNKIGQDTLYHSARYPTALVLPVTE